MKVLVVLAACVLAVSQAAYPQHGYGGGYSGPQASPVVTPQGFLAETPEVAAAKAAHFAEFAKASSPAGYAPGPYNGAPAYSGYAPAAPAYSAPAQYHAPAAAPSPYAHNPSVTPQGFLADTPDVAAAKAAHFAEVAKTKTSPSYGPESYDDGSYKPEYDSPSYSAPAAPAPAYSGYSAPAGSYQQYSAPQQYSGPQQYSAPAPAYGSQYTGPLASPVVTPQGFLAETPEVAAAKAAHFAEVAKAGSHAPSHAHGRYRRSTVLVQTPAHTAPLAVYAAPAPVHSYYAAPFAAPYASPYAYTYPGYSYHLRTL